MTYSDETMRRMEASIGKATEGFRAIGEAAQKASEIEWPNIGDTCCGRCEGSCCVDGVTGA